MTKHRSMSASVCRCRLPCVDGSETGIITDVMYATIKWNWRAM